MDPIRVMEHTGHREPEPKKSSLWQHGRKGAAKARHGIRPLVSFWIKISNDWIFNLAGVLAYNLLLSAFPILLLLLAVTGFAINDLSQAASCVSAISCRMRYPMVQRPVCWSM